jgi:hypothetical protein
MAKSVKIIVEGIADVKFLSDYISHIKPEFEKKDVIIDSGGWTKINSQKEEGESIRNQMTENTDKGGMNLVIFDADNDYAKRKKEIEDWKTKFSMSFELFLFPNNKDIGALEELLEKIILDKNQPIFDCWEKYEKCLQSKSIEGRTSLTTPAKKTKIYGYLEALLGTSKKEKDQIKERERNYQNPEHWNLDGAFLNPLKDFLLKHL